jgi:hypothetical protein
MQCLLDIRTYAMIGQRSSQQQQQQQQQQHRHLSTFRATLISLGEIARRMLFTVSGAFNNQALPGSVCVTRIYMPLHPSEVSLAQARS